MKEILCVWYLVMVAVAAGQTKISELPSLTGANAAAGDFVPIVDVSAGAAGSKKMTLQELFSAPGVSYQAGLIGGAYGGTGVNNSGRSITLGGNLMTVGSGPLVLTTSGSTNVTLPTSGTLATTAQVAAIDKGAVGLGNVDDTADADKPVSAAVQAALEGKASTTLSNVDSNASNFDVQGALDVVSAQPYSAGLIGSWTASTSAPPVRIAGLGDSIWTGIEPGPNMTRAGVIGLGLYNATGGVTTHSGPGDARFDYWINGRAYTFPIGSSGEFTNSGSATGDLSGDTVFVAYIAGSGRGSFDIETQTNGSGSWIKQGATVNTSNASTIGVATTRSLSTISSPYYRLRINNVTTASVTIIATGIYHSNGGGVIWMPIGAFSGIDVSQCNTTPSAVFNPIWQALAPTAVITAWADAASEWGSDGAFRTFHANAQAAYTGGTDWIVVSQNVAANEVDHAAKRTSQRAWALETGNTFVNGRACFPDWTESLARGWVTDDATDVHLSATGQAIRNYHLWKSIPLFQWDLGQVAGPNYMSSVPGYYAMFNMRSASTIDASNVETKHAIRTYGSTSGISVGDRAQPLSSSQDWTIYNSGSTLRLYSGGDRVLFDSQGMTLTNGLIATSQSLSGSGVIAVNVLTSKLTTTAPAQEVTLANGTDGQIKTIVHVATSGGGTAVLTPATKTGYTTITFTNAGESATLQYFNTIGWVIVSLRGAVAA